ncbi:basic amino acid/polyamine antiporter [Avibacterium paragallinarum]|uniref:Basic amino acid/polyamine antiporter n=1 Tax=Avibacterium paragallinarum TaxID=728 RepID=A0ABU7QKW0_AVIPA|nr:basic amino acid/polyamine antiporter [Avibacterium paragallinarum]MEE3609715.1 basic amino acid/polyamine antiporter [Avibacterium paragallinarum]MEE3621757.1 basic amino acid/polyamine antiporter [Avibacterium paragallinarum]MEE3669505.1 basic amino acid/polyamine antiporter [Avibacterium paragallinarum]MEE3681804.1 basic amino acid/polyamine antiporter [Avibacterium paragallinarum]MEE4385774.1 basic amino acid/polyamine antiporter [Avibacterium paragallinarum]
MSNKKIGLISLTALVLSSMIGSGIFSLPQNMAAVAGSEALLIGWLITGIGIIFLGLSFFFISRLKPELDGGIYTYAREGFGNLMGFLSAWGYWLCATIGIVGYLVVAFEGIGTFTDSESAVIFGQGNTIASFIGASCVVWLVHILIAKGLKEAASVNLVATIVKVFPLILFIALALWFFSPDTFNLDTKATALNNSVSDQVKNTMLITLWVFTGVEGAAVLSAHAKKRTDVGLATVLGIVIALILYVAITVLSLGLLPREAIAQMANPSMAGLLELMIGKSGKVLITFCLIVSVLASYISWTMYSAEVPYRGAKNGAFPQILNKLNRNDVPINSLWFTGLVVQLCLFLVLLTGKTYDALLLISTSMILVPYLLIGAYLLKLSFQQSSHWYIKFTGFMATLYALWILYAAGLDYLLISVALYVPGIALFLYSRYQSQGKRLNLNHWEKVLLAIFAILFIWAIKVLMNFEF